MQKKFGLFNDIITERIIQGNPPKNAALEIEFALNEWHFFGSPCIICVQVYLKKSFLLSKSRDI